MLRTGNIVKSSKSLQSVKCRITRRTVFIQSVKTPNENSLIFKPVFKNSAKTILPQVTNSSSPNGQDPDSTTLQQQQQHAVSNAYEFMSLAEAKNCRLAAEILTIPSVKSMMIGRDFISVRVDDETMWPIVKPDFYGVLMNYFKDDQGVGGNQDNESIESQSAAQSVFTVEDVQSWSTRNASDGGDHSTSSSQSEPDSEVVIAIKTLLDTRIRPLIHQDGGDIVFDSFNEDDGVLKVILKGSCRGCSSSVTTLKGGVESMLKYYIPQVTRVDQVDDEADEEFKKLEQKLGDNKVSGNE
ncbi:hypothetical protein MP228_009691 [Amoeboaphelidium protococcarum]|nr:hypothetical protein MP228_009691 [Amoeboaphelidium protococcarum]